MKRSAKKLVLSRETIGNLSQRNLSAAVGGSGASCDPTCNTMCFVCPPQTNGSKCYSDCDTCVTC